MKKNAKLVLGLLASILCVGAIGGLVYGIYKISDDNSVNKEKKSYDITINYFKDNVIDANLSLNFKAKEGDIINLLEYKIDIDGYKFYMKDYSSWTLNVLNNSNINFYYSKINEDIDKEFIDVNFKIYVSNNGKDGIYDLYDQGILNDVDGSNLSINKVYNLIIEKYFSLSDYTLNSSSCYMDGYNFGIYLYKNSENPDQGGEPFIFDLSVSLFIDYYGDSDGYIGGQFYTIKDVSSSYSLNDVFSYICYQDSTISRDLIIDEEKSKISIVDKHCDLYVYEEGTDPDIPDDKEYIIGHEFRCYDCGRELVWTTKAICTNPQCDGSHEFYKEYQTVTDPDTLAIIKQTVIVEKGNINDLKQSDFED